jgi:FixJ family two-component response regulator/signal transduction histidine kinase
MRPRKYIFSERVAAPAISAEVITLDAGVDRRYRPNTAEPLTFKLQRQSRTQERNNLDVRPSPEQQRLTAHALQEVLFSADVAIVLLDVDLTIRFFTPAAARLFEVIPGDIGRPLTKQKPLGSEATLVNDATKVLQSLEPIEREIEALSGEWYVRRISPYRPEGQTIEGIVVTFVDITRQKQTAAALECARVRADSANVAKSRFLAAASHDLRQPLQTLVLLQELLSNVVTDDKARKLVDRIDHTIGSMSGMLNGLLDINRIEAGTIRAEFETFPIGVLLNRVKVDLACQAEAQRIALDVLPCRSFVRSDPRLLEQMIRNLLSNAIKYTKRGRVLIGCRPRNGKLSIQIWDTGVGIPENQLQNIFEEYHQLDNSARNRSRGLGLGLSIVKRLGVLLDHPVRVRSELGKGSVFSIEVAQHSGGTPGRRDEPSDFQVEHADATRGGRFLVEDKPELRDLLETDLCAATATKPAPLVYVVDDDGDLRCAIRCMLEHDGRIVEDYEDAESFLAAYRPGHDACLLIDADLPGMSGLNVLRRLKDAGHPLPAIMITGWSDVPTAVEAMKAGASDFLEKPIRGVELLRGVAHALELSRDSGKLTEWRKDAADHLAGLTRRQQQILEMVLAGHPSKNIAVDLGISRRTVESHRASIMKKAGVRSLPALARLALAATGDW